MRSFDNGSVIIWVDGEPYPVSESGSALDLEISGEDILEIVEHIPHESRYDYTDLSDWKNQYGR